ncbi:MAG: hypothetical protein QM750_14475 [Rubrivivax sp.]
MARCRALPERQHQQHCLRAVLAAARARDADALRQLALQVPQKVR